MYFQVYILSDVYLNRETDGRRKKTGNDHSIVNSTSPSLVCAVVIRIDTHTDCNTLASYEK
jgi:hypothetical protein